MLYYAFILYHYKCNLELKLNQEPWPSLFLTATFVTKWFQKYEFI